MGLVIGLSAFISSQKSVFGWGTPQMRSLVFFQCNASTVEYLPGTAVYVCRATTTEPIQYTVGPPTGNNQTRTF